MDTRPICFMVNSISWIGGSIADGAEVLLMRLVRARADRLDEFGVTFLRLVAFLADALNLGL